MNGSSKSRSPEARKPTADGRRSTRGAGTKGSVARSESPTKKTPARKMATPRKPRKNARGGSAQPESINGDAPKHEEENVKVQVETEKLPSPDGDDEIEHTKVNIEMPAHSPDLELPNDAEDMLEKAREMVAAANQVGGGGRTTTPLRSKRKASEMDPDDLDAPVGPVAKRARQTELELRKERIKRRALTGIATCVAIGYVSASQRTLWRVFANCAAARWCPASWLSWALFHSQAGSSGTVPALLKIILDWLLFFTPMIPLYVTSFVHGVCATWRAQGMCCAGFLATAANAGLIAW